MAGPCGPRAPPDTSPRRLAERQAPAGGHDPMARSYSAVDLVQLPNLDAGSAQALGAEILNAADKVKGAEPLPESVAEALGDLSQALLVLRKAAAKRLAPPGDPQRAKLADQAIDAAWSGFFDWLSGWAKMPGLAKAKIAGDLSTKLFADGLKFVLLAYKLEWAESDARLLLIKQRKLDVEIKQLGGEDILKALHAAHKAYGEAIGITATPEDSAKIRDALDGFTDALRAYVIRVSASVSKKDKKSPARAEALLKPIVTWETPGGEGKSGGDEAAGQPPPEGGEAPKSPEEAPKSPGEEPK